MKRQAYYILDPETDTKQEGDEFFNDAGLWTDTNLSVKFAHGYVYRRPVPAPEPEYVPLTAEDVPPGSVLRPAAFPEGWIAIVAVLGKGVVTCIDFKLGMVGWNQLFESECKWEIKRPGEDWQPCKKLSK